ncbi:MAG: ribbon-helix-helix domain-containing protein [Bdellovibrionales bacterium]|nr:ribbon-helix-helix domain-containing protein [Bdellovibrionales bacterium]
MPKKIATTVYITEEQQQLLKELNQRSRVPIAEFIRQGIDMVLLKYQNLLPGQIPLEPLPLGRPSSDVEQAQVLEV